MTPRKKSNAVTADAVTGSTEGYRLRKNPWRARQPEERKKPGAGLLTKQIFGQVKPGPGTRGISDGNESPDQDAN